MELLKNKKKGITIVDIDKLKVIPDIIKDTSGGYSIPTWVFVKPGIIDPINIQNNRNTKFGVSEVGSLAKNGKNMIDPSLFNNKDNLLWANQNGISNDPGTFDYSTRFVGNNIGMVRPGGPEDALLSTNYNCNIVNRPGSNLIEYGLYTDSTTPFKFGKNTRNSLNTRNNNFGEILLNEYAGASQGNNILPMKFNSDYYISNYFGTKGKGTKRTKIIKPKVKKNIPKLKPKVKKNSKPIKEGTVITIKRKKNGKSKIKIN
jgi:hypothetical protein